MVLQTLRQKLYLTNDGIISKPTILPCKAQKFAQILIRITIVKYNLANFLANISPSSLCPEKKLTSRSVFLAANKGHLC